MGLLPSLAGDPIQSLMGEKDSQETSLDLNLERGPETKKGYCTFYRSVLSILHCACLGPSGRSGDACPTHSPALPQLSLTPTPSSALSCPLLPSYLWGVP